MEVLFALMKAGGSVAEMLWTRPGSRMEATPLLRKTETLPRKPNGSSWKLMGSFSSFHDSFSFSFRGGS